MSAPFESDFRGSRSAGRLSLASALTSIAARRSGVWTTHLVALSAAIVIVLALFSRDAIDMASQWWNASTYGHCLFILPLVAWLIWQRRFEVAAIEPRAWAPGLIVLAAAAFGWLIGEAAGVALIRHAALVAMIQAAVLAILGPAVFRGLLFPVFFLVFLIPFGDEFVPAMQTLTARMTMAMLNIANVPANIDGVFITIPNGWFEVAEACAGVKFLVAMIAYGALVANVCFHRWNRRILFMILCIVVPILANGVRAFATIFAAHLTSVKAATGFDHIVYGWFFFAFVMAAVMALSWRFFDRKISDPWLGERFSAVGKRRSPYAVALAAIGLALMPGLWDSVVMARGRQRLPHAIVLPVVSGWTVVPNNVGLPWAPRFDGADHALLGRYRNTIGQEVDVGIALYGWQAERRKIVGFAQGAIDPTGPWAWAADIAAPPEGKAQLMRAPGKLMREAVTFYVLGSGATGDVLTVKLRTLRARLTGGDQSAAVVIVSAQGGHAHAAIERFLRDFGSVDARTTRLLIIARGG